jgi:hypothetical protein
MKIDKLETHDRLEHFKADQNDVIVQGLQDCLKRNPLSLALQDRSRYIYIYAHPRTTEMGNAKVMYWQPRLSKPKMETNSYLFRVQSFSDKCEIMWMLPPKELWGQYDKGKVTENDVVAWSIAMFQTQKEKMEQPHPDDWGDIIGLQILKEAQRSLQQEKLVMESVSSMLEREKQLLSKNGKNYQRIY